MKASTTTHPYDPSIFLVPGDDDVVAVCWIEKETTGDEPPTFVHMAEHLMEHLMHEPMPPWLGHATVAYHSTAPPDLAALLTGDDLAAKYAHGDEAVSEVLMVTIVGEGHAGTHIYRLPFVDSSPECIATSATVGTITALLSAMMLALAARIDP
jgi:hypothetical protein